MKVHRSNRVEQLLDALAAVLAERENAPGPLQTEVVVVHSRGMGVWLAQRLAERTGVWAGAEFPFPRRFVQEVFAAVLGHEAVLSEAWTQPRLLWSVLSSLDEMVGRASFAELRRFLSDDPKGLHRFQLADRIARVFDQYLVFRPELVLGWSRGEDDHWQAELWRLLEQRLGNAHLPARAAEVFARLERRQVDLAGLPTRVSVFGISTLPPLFLRILAALSRIIDVHLFSVSASREYWAEIRTAKEARRATRDRGLPPAPADDDIPPLLASLGTVGRDFQRILESEDDYEEPFGDLYVDPTEGQHPPSMLATVQADLLALRRRGGRGGIGEPRPIAPGDRSITLHACHARMREVEVLHDRILDLLATDPELQPRDIVVMAPDIETYAPLVEAVFGRDPSDPSYVPYCIADRSARGDSSTIEALNRIFDLAHGRMQASEVLDLLALDPIARRFELTTDDVDTLTEWIDRAQIRWGRDSAHRRAHDQPAFAANTWRFGLDRLLLGVALPGREREIFAGVLPYDEIEGQPTRLLGSLTELCETLFRFVAELERPRTMRQWAGLLGELTDALLSERGTSGWDLQQLRTVLRTLTDESETSGYDGLLELGALRTLLQDRLEEERPIRGFLAQGVTFCALLPMRSVPFRVVGLLGMGDRDFPRASTPVGFDLVAKHPRVGDRSRRTDDRYLFLEALLAARQRLLVCYVGQSIQDNADLPPSVVLSELLDVLEESFVPPPGVASVRDHVVVRHPMQPFSPRYFGADPDRRLFSFAEHYLQGAQALLDAAPRLPRTPLLSAPLPPVEHDERTLEIPVAHLIRFFRAPIPELLKRRLGIYLGDDERDRSDREPIELDPLEGWKLGDLMLQHMLEELTPERSLTLLQASGQLPLGTPGRCHFDALRSTVEPIADAVRSARGGERLGPLEIDLRIGDVRLVGALGLRFPQGVVEATYSTLSARHRITAWIRHLLCCAVAPRDQALRTLLIGRADDETLEATTCRFETVADPRQHLAQLIELYTLGQQEPVLLFPNASLQLCRKALQDGADEAMRAARKVFEGFEGRQNPYVKRLFGDVDVLARGFTPFDAPLRGGDFFDVSVRVFGPMLAHET